MAPRSGTDKDLCTPNHPSSGALFILTVQFGPLPGGKAKAKERGTFASITARQVPKINGTPHGAKSSSDGAMEDEMRRALIGLTVAALTVLALAGPASAAPAR